MKESALVFLNRHIDKFILVFLALFFTGVAVHLTHHGTADERLIMAVIGGITGALGALFILMNTGRSGNRNTDQGNNDKAVK